MKELLKDFLAETGENIELVGVQLVRFEQDPSDSRIIANIFRLVHTIKGTCGFLDLPRLEALAHAAETLISTLRDGVPATREIVSLVLSAIDQIKRILAGIDAASGEPGGDDGDLINALVQMADKAAPLAQAKQLAARAATSVADAYQPMTSLPAERRVDTIRVSVKTIDTIMTLVSELVLTRNQLAERGERIANDALKSPLLRLSSVTSQLQRGIMAVRLQKIEHLFANLPRLVRDLSSAVGKTILFEVTGGETELDRQIIEVIRDPLTHLIRNAIDHGIESAEARCARGKAAPGKISVRARHEAGHLELVVADDGCGLDVARIRSQAIATGHATEETLETFDAADIYKFIFAPGFTTAGSLTNLSGRGIGLDVVRANVESIGGSVAVQTSLGHGTSFTLKIPLTVAIVPGLIVRVGAERFAIPQYAVDEIISVGAPDDPGVETANGINVLPLRGAVLPILDLRKLFDPLAAADAGDMRLVVSMRLGTNQFGAIVDDVAGVQEIVVKPMPQLLHGLGLFNGTTILGDGAIVLMVDPAGIASRLGLGAAKIFKTVPAPHYRTAETKTRLLVFHAGENGLCALPIAVAQSVVQIAGGDVTHEDGAATIQYLGRQAPLALAHDAINLEAAGDGDTPKLSVLMIEEGGRTLGLVIDSPVDMIDVALPADMGAKLNGALGSFRHADTGVTLLDVQRFFRRLAPPAQASAARAAGGPRILIADASPFFRGLLRPLLTAAGCETAVAATLREAEAQWGDGPGFDALMIDMAMARDHAPALAHLAGQRPDGQSPRVIGLCAHATPQMIKAAQAQGMLTAVGKFDRSALLDLLRKTFDLAPQAGAAA